MSVYHNLISKATGVTNTSDLDEIEQEMRNERGTLNSLSAAQITSEAKTAWQVVQYFRTPEGLAAIKAALS